MKTLELSVAEAKKRFSEALNQTVYGSHRIIITKHSRPVAALVSLEDLKLIEARKKKEEKGLLALVNKWKDFDDIEPDIMKAYHSRRKEKPGRDVSL